MDDTDNSSVYFATMYKQARVVISVCKPVLGKQKWPAKQEAR